MINSFPLAVVKKKLGRILSYLSNQRAICWRWMSDLSEMEMVNLLRYFGDMCPRPAGPPNRSSTGGSSMVILKSHFPLAEIMGLDRNGSEMYPQQRWFAQILAGRCGRQRSLRGGPYWIPVSHLFLLSATPWQKRGRCQKGPYANAPSAPEPVALPIGVFKRRREFHSLFLASWSQMSRQIQWKQPPDFLLL